MDASFWACCGVLGTFVAYYPLSLLFSRAYPKSVAILRKYISTPPIIRKLLLGSIHGRKLSVNICGTGIVTPLYLIFAIAVLILNVVILALSAKSRNLLIWRSGRVLAFDLCILIVSGRQSFFSDSLGNAYEFQAFFHRWLGRVVFLVGIIHVVVALVPYQPDGVTLSSRPHIAGFTAASALFALILSSFSSVRQTFYEIFRYCHIFFAVIIVVGGFLHLTPVGVSKPSAILFIITAIMYCLLFSLRTGMLILQRATTGGFYDNGLLRLDIELTRPIHVQAGQHIWLRIPSTSYTSFAESHPFAIASWGKTRNGKQLITLLIDVREGFTWKLKELFKWESKSLVLLKDYFEGRYGQVTIHEGKKRIEINDQMKVDVDLTEIKKLLTSPESNKSQSLTDYIDGFFRLEIKAIDLQNMLTWKTKQPVESAYIDGPYGQPIRADEFGTVILYATGIGIGAQLAIVKHLLECREAGTAKTQRVTLLWEVDHVYVGCDKESKKHFIEDDNAQQMVKDLLQQDCDRLSRLRLDPAATFKYRSGWQGAPPDQGYMFRCTRYVRNKPQNVELDLDENDEDNHSSTDTLRTRYRGLNPEASLESQLQHDNCRGRVLVSVCANPAFADSIRSIVATKGLHLHEHEFRPERWPRIKRNQGTAGNEDPARNEKTIGYEYRPAEVKPVRYTDPGTAGREFSAGNEKTIGYEYRTASETTIAYSAN